MNSKKQLKKQLKIVNKIIKNLNAATLTIIKNGCVREYSFIDSKVKISTEYTSLYEITKSLEYYTRKYDVIKSKIEDLDKQL